MKQFLQISFIIGIGWLGWSACTDDAVNNSISTNTVAPTYLLSLNIAKPPLHSTGDFYSTEAEARLRTVDVFIYDTLGNYVSHTPLTANDFVQATPSVGTAQDCYDATTRIATTTGAKKLLVAVNFPPSFVASLENKDINQWTTVAQTLSLNDLVAADGTIAMTSSEIVDCNFTVGKNRPTVTVQRMVAKISVHQSATIKQIGIPGTLHYLSFAVNNFNNRSFLLKTDTDANWDSYDANEYTQAQDNDYVLVNNSDAVNVRYAAENSSKNHLAKELTRATIRAAFLPANVVILSGENYLTVTSLSQGVNTPQTFYMITYYQPNPTVYCFFDKSTAESYALSHEKTEADVVTYTNGLCYWDLYLNQNVWDVVRNDYYRCTITQIFAPGRPSSELPYPEEQITPDKALPSIGQPLQWDESIIDYELQP